MRTLISKLVVVVAFFPSNAEQCTRKRQMWYVNRKTDKCRKNEKLS